MSDISIESISRAIAAYQDPYLGKGLADLGLVKSVTASGAEVQVALEFPYAMAGLQGAIRQMLSHAIEDVEGVETVKIDIKQVVQPSKSPNNLPAMRKIKNIIAIASGKGGVGKSTVSVNFALALAAEGARVGILDADIYGPSIGMMLGVAEGVRPQVKDGKYFMPVVAHGIQSMSMAYLVTDDTPMVWRGPMVSGALLQLLTQTLWDELDYLVIDMPPGTGDIQLTLSQKVPVTGAIVVTTPQDVALLDCKKGIEMFRKVNVPVIGVVENMATFCCPNCGHTEAIFGEGGGERIAEQYHAALIGQLPLNRSIREQADSGNPTVVSHPDSPIALLYRDMARKATALLSQQIIVDELAFPEIIIRSSR
jgi:ATP-binding protein involved in chromosome partitioning